MFVRVLPGMCNRYQSRFIESERRRVPKTLNFKLLFSGDKITKIVVSIT
jgi:hypothetical protein